jgi:heme A synthase
MMARRLSSFQTLALWTTGTTYFLILVGGLVRASGAGLGCPDWPRCFGSWIPPASAAELPAGFEASQFNPTLMWTEYLNRLLGVTVGLLIFATLVSAWRNHRHTPRIFWPTLAAFLLVGFQGWLGGVVVQQELAAWLVTVHMVVALVIVSLLLYATVYAFTARYRAVDDADAAAARDGADRISADYADYADSGVAGATAGAGDAKPPRDPNNLRNLRNLRISDLRISDLRISDPRISDPRNRPASARPLVAGSTLALIVITLVQVVLGTQVRERVDHAMDAGVTRFGALATVGQFDMWHREMALLVMAATALVAWLVWARYRRDTALTRATVVLVALVVIQILLGVAMAYVALTPAAQVAHLTASSLLLGAETLVFLLARWLPATVE